MFKFFKNLFKPKEKIKSINYNESLINELYKLYYDNNLESLLLDPVNKLYIINVYYISLYDLIDNVLVTNSNNELISINLYSYFKPLYSNTNSLSINELLKRLIYLLEKNVINTKVKSDILELISAYDTLKGLTYGREFT